jgi:SAM-dependent methyltransferase
MRVAYSVCPLCESENMTFERLGDCSAHPLFKPEIPAEIRWMRCSDCDHSFTDGYFSDEAQEILFSSVNPAQILGAGDVYWQRAVSARMVEKVVSVKGTADGDWLDVGFGNGALLTTAQEFGFTPFGLDARQKAVDALHQYGISASTEPFLEFSGDERFDVISMADVLEHLPYPRPILNHANELLNKDGCLFLSMPNIDSFVWKFKNTTGANPFWNEIEHYHNFGRQRLYALLEECGFVPVRYGISERYYMCMEVISVKKESRS